MLSVSEIDRFKQQVKTDFESRQNYDQQAEFQVAIADRLVQLAEIQLGQNLLDLATGTGFVAIAAASRVGPTGSVVGVDLSPAMLQQAQRKAQQLGLNNLSFLEMDGDRLTFQGNSFDGILCASSLAYFTNLSHIAHQWYHCLRPGGWVGFSYFGENAFPVAQQLRELADRYSIILPNPNQPLGTAEKCHQFLESAGFQNIQIHLENWGRYLNTKSGTEGAWNAITRSAFGVQVFDLPPVELIRLKQEFMAIVSQQTTEQGIWNDIPTFFVFGTK